MRILCPKHDDTNPSMFIYEHFAHCFVCGAHIPSEEVVSSEELQTVKREPEVILEMISYINTLPLQMVRGLVLPVDKDYYYIVWPDNSFYKKRKYNTKSNESKYLGPRGQKPPLFVIDGNKKNLIIVEGELNALSICTYVKGEYFTIVSPGSATQLPSFLHKYLTYDNIFIIVDKDAPGVAYGLYLKEELLKHKKSPILIAMPTDYNDLLQKHGIAGVQEEFKKQMAVYRVPQLG